MLISLEKIKTELNQSNFTTKLWIYPFLEKLNSQDKEKISNRLNSFLKGWQSHRKEIEANFFFKYDRFLILFSKIKGEISGCAIDASVNVIKNIQRKVWKEVANKTMLFFQKKVTGEIIFFPRYELQKQIENKNLSQEDYFFDNGIATFQEYLKDQWKLKITDSWLMKEFNWIEKN